MDADSTRGTSAVAELLAALSDPLVEIELRHQLAHEAYERGRADGWRQGYESAEADMAGRWRAASQRIARGGISYRELEARRWVLRGEQRDRETFGQPHPDDRVSRSGQEAAA